MPSPNSTVMAEALAAIQARIAAACGAAGRPAGCVTLVAVSKTHAADLVLAAVAAGQHHFGENRVQEATSKFAPLRQGHPDLRMHLIGGLQTNKAEEAVRIADVIESLDRPRLADAIETAASKAGRLPDLLIQVNIGDEPQKSGIACDAAAGFIAACQARFGAKLRGLMCIPPADRDPVPYFRQLASMAAHHGLPDVSMGMSGDFELAILHGATHVRVGSALFGVR